MTSEENVLEGNFIMAADKTKIIDSLLYICSNKPKGQTVRFWMIQNLPPVALDWDQELKFVEAVREFLKVKKIMDNFTIREIEDPIKDIISGALQLPASQRPAYLASSINALFSAFRVQIENFQIVVPISNLSITQDFTIGNVKFRKFSPYQERKWAGISRNILRSNPNYNKKQKKEFVEKMRERNLRPLVGYVCAETFSQARKERAKEIAFRRINEALDVVKLYCMIQHRQGYNDLGLKGEVLDSTIRSFLQLSLSGSRAFTPTLERVGPLFPLTIDKNKLAMMRKRGLCQMTKILKTVNRTWVEKRILRAIYWYSRIFDTPIERIDDEKIIVGRGLHSTKKEEHLEYGCINQRLAKAFIAIESLYVISESESIQNNVAERAAFLLAKDYTSRKRIKRFLKDMYKLRSDVVHRGLTYVSIGELNQLIYLLSDSIITLILKKNRLKLHSSQEFYEHFEKQKFT